tara:strand:+ start:286 stop:756 length:471 start_codon:yes stop_codon:yes gene_type:complete
MSEWFTGAGEQIGFQEILDIIGSHSSETGHVCVGTDSFIKKNECIFATAICLYGAKDQKGGRYFIKRNKIKKSKYKTLVQRITEEVQRSVEIGFQILEMHPVVNVELHLDISRADKNKKTSKFADMLVGYATGAGFECKIKPHAFAAASVADKHSK